MTTGLFIRGFLCHLASYVADYIDFMSFYLKVFVFLFGVVIIVLDVVGRLGVFLLPPRGIEFLVPWCRVATPVDQSRLCPDRISV